MTPLDRLTANQPMTIARIDCADAALLARLHEMGFDEGVDIALLHRAPMGGDPIAVRVGAMTVALRRAMAACVWTVPATAAE